MSGELLLGARAGAALPLGGDEFQWRAADGALALRLSGRELGALDVCRPFRTRDEHVVQLSQALGIPPGRATRVVDGLIERGVLFDPIAWLGATLPAPAPPAPEPLILVRSWRRHDALKALCASLLEDERRWGARRRYLFVDNDVDAGACAENRSTAAAFARESGSQVRFLGQDRLDAAFASVARAVAASDHAALRTLLDPAQPCLPSGARSWNWGVLAAAGGTLSIVDNDCRLPLRQLPGARSTFDLRDNLASSTRYLDGTDFAQFPLLATDPFAHAAQWIGQPARSVLARSGVEASSLRGRSAEQLAHLGTNAKVLAAFGGVYGSLAFETTSVLHLGDPDSLANLFREPFRIERLAAETVFYGVDAPRLTSYASYSPLALDCRELLPFIATWGRVDDSFFLSLAKSIAPDAAFVYLNASIGHFQVEQRERLAAAESALRLDMNVFVAQFLADASMALRSRDRGLRLAALGAVAQELHAASDAVLTDEILRWRHADCAHMAERLGAQLEQYPRAPAQWRAKVEGAIAANRRILDESILAPQELQHARNALAQAAAGCRFWPALFAYAATERPLDSMALLLS